MENNNNVLNTRQSMSINANNIIEADKLSFSYRDVKVLSKVSFSVKEGDFVAVIGENGAGKSTLMKLLLGNLEASSGTVKILNQDPRRAKKIPELSYVAQEGLNKLNNFPANAEEIVLTGLYSKCHRFLPHNKKDKEKVKEALERSGVANLSRRLISEMSGGQRQRVLLAKALISNPKLIFLDEPTTGIDDKQVHSFYELLYRLNKEENLTIFMITHDVERICGFAKRILVLKDKGIIELSPESLHQDALLPYKHLKSLHHCEHDDCPWNEEEN